MVVIENIGEVDAYIDDDETRGITLFSSYTFIGFWDVTTDSWYGITGQMLIPS